MKHIFSKENRALLAELVRTDFKLRYQGSVLGYAWSLLRPLFMFGILYVIFGLVLKSGDGVPHFPAYLLLGVVLWTFFTDMTNQSLGSIVERGDLVRKIRIPRWMIVFSSSVGALINLGLNLSIISVFFIWNGVEVRQTVLLLPLLIVELYIFSTGISYFLSAIFVKLRDVRYIWEVLLQAGFYLTPILYAMTIIPSTFIQKVMLLNPLAQIIQDSRFLAVSNDPKVITAYRVFDGGVYTFIPFVLVILVFLGGVVYFKSQVDSFAENL